MKILFPTAFGTPNSKFLNRVPETGAGAESFTPEAGNDDAARQQAEFKAMMDRIPEKYREVARAYLSRTADLHDFDNESGLDGREAGNFLNAMEGRAELIASSEVVAQALDKFSENIEDILRVVVALQPEQVDSFLESGLTQNLTPDQLVARARTINLLNRYYEREIKTHFHHRMAVHFDRDLIAHPNSPEFNEKVIETALRYEWISQEEITDEFGEEFSTNEKAILARRLMMQDKSIWANRGESEALTRLEGVVGDLVQNRTDETTALRTAEALQGAAAEPTRIALDAYGAPAADREVASENALSDEQVRNTETFLQTIEGYKPDLLADVLAVRQSIRANDLTATKAALEKVVAEALDTVSGWNLSTDKYMNDEGEWITFSAEAIMNDPSAMIQALRELNDTTSAANETSRRTREGLVAAREAGGEVSERELSIITKYEEALKSADAANEASAKFDQMVNLVKQNDPLFAERMIANRETMIDNMAKDLTFMKVLDADIASNGSEGLGSLLAIYDDMKGLYGFLNFTDENAAIARDVMIFAGTMMIPFGAIINVAGRVVGGAAKLALQGATRTRVVVQGAGTRLTNAIPARGAGALDDTGRVVSQTTPGRDALLRLQSPISRVQGRSAAVDALAAGARIEDVMVLAQARGIKMADILATAEGNAAALTAIRGNMAKFVTAAGDDAAALRQLVVTAGDDAAAIGVIRTNMATFVNAASEHAATMARLIATTGDDAAALRQIVVAAGDDVNALKTILASAGDDATAMTRILATAGDDAAAMTRLVAAAGDDAALMSRILATASDDAATMTKLVAAAGDDANALKTILATAGDDAAAVAAIRTNMAKFVATAGDDATVLKQLAVAAGDDAAAIAVIRTNMAKFVTAAGDDATILRQLAVAAGDDAAAIAVIRTNMTKFVTAAGDDAAVLRQLAVAAGDDAAAIGVIRTNMAKFVTAAGDDAASLNRLVVAAGDDATAIAAIRANMAKFATAASDDAAAMSRLVATAGDDVNALKQLVIAAGDDAAAIGVIRTNMAKFVTAAGDDATVLRQLAVAAGDDAAAIGVIRTNMAKFVTAAGDDATMLRQLAVAAGDDAAAIAVIRTNMTKFVTAAGDDAASLNRLVVAAGDDAAAIAVIRTNMARFATAASDDAAALSRLMTTAGDDAAAIRTILTEASNNSAALGRVLQSASASERQLAIKALVEVRGSLQQVMANMDNPALLFRFADDPEDFKHILDHFIIGGKISPTLPAQLRSAGLRESFLARAANLTDEGVRGLIDDVFGAGTLARVESNALKARLGTQLSSAYDTVMAGKSAVMQLSLRRNLDNVLNKLASRDLSGLNRGLKDLHAHLQGQAAKAAPLWEGVITRVTATLPADAREVALRGVASTLVVAAVVEPAPVLADTGLEDGKGEVIIPDSETSGVLGERPKFDNVDALIEGLSLDHLAHPETRGEVLAILAQYQAEYNRGDWIKVGLELAKVFGVEEGFETDEAEIRADGSKLRAFGAKVQEIINHANEFKPDIDRDGKIGRQSLIDLESAIEARAADLALAGEGITEEKVAARRTELEAIAKIEDPNERNIKFAQALGFKVPEGEAGQAAAERVVLQMARTVGFDPAEGLTEANMEKVLAHDWSLSPVRDLTSADFSSLTAEQTGQITTTLEGDADRATRTGEIAKIFGFNLPKGPDGKYLYNQEARGFVEDLQKALGVGVDGVLGSKTLAALREADFKTLTIS